MIIRCAWCGVIQSNKPPYGGNYEKMITDGICEQCLGKYFPIEKRRKECPMENHELKDG